MINNKNIIDELYKVVLDRKKHPSDASYTSSLMQKGIDKILKKVGEEATEVVIAAKGGKKDEIIYETADLFFHLIVMLGYCDIKPEDVYSELAKRFGISGIEEKASRTSVK